MDDAHLPTRARPGSTGAPQLSLAAVFVRFLRFGLLAWGGPVAQIGMLRDELVDRERWIDPDRFNRVLAVYQALPGPEAHELCVYFGTVARGRWGGLLAGFGFLLPGAIAMLLVAWLYTSVGVGGRVAAASLAGVQVAALALVLRAVRRIGGHALRRRGDWCIALLVAAALLVAGAADGPAVDATVTDAPRAGEATPAGAAGVGLIAGSLSFGGAYTSVGFVREAAVADRGWLTDAQLLDGVGLAGALPAPMVVFATFAGYLGGGLAAALAITLGIFAPAFAITLVGHRPLERLVDDPRLHRLLDLVTAAVVGLITVTALSLARAAVTGLGDALLLVVALVALWRWRSRISIVVVVGGCAVAAGSAALVT